MTQPRETRPQPAAGAEIGSLIGGAFGLVFLIVNSASFSTLGRILVLVMGIAAFAVIVFFAIRSLGRMKRAQVSSATSVESVESAESAESAEGQAAAGPRRTVPFGRSYWIIVGIEALALFGGTRLLSGLGHPELGVAWVAFVVGTHFYALGHVFKLNRFHILATVVTLCGIAGFIAFFASIPAFIPIFSGIISGFVLLAFGLWALVPVDGERA
ncbi:hypothetical protein BSP239C_00423 [Brevibacterium sp. 239c]|uniref:hypothetical protein n=1 Tax=Brevibacterium sp. 239c TaxID=1965356 RepID=UPI000C4E297E|nr:hypothetical protein [Brevibacterium sp. 239c]SMX70118.1 hypothetical protein BSP239C_00423 [Brevibacterium sp. 239c]